MKRKLKPTLWPLRNVSTQINMRNTRRLIRADTFREAKMSIRVSLRGMLVFSRDGSIIERVEQHCYGYWNRPFYY